MEINLEDLNDEQDLLCDAIAPLKARDVKSWVERECLPFGFDYYIAYRLKDGTLVSTDKRINCKKIRGEKADPEPTNQDREKVNHLDEYRDLQTIIASYRLTAEHVDKELAEKDERISEFEKELKEGSIRPHNCFDVRGMDVEYKKTDNAELLTSKPFDNKMAENINTLKEALKPFAAMGAKLKYKIPVREFRQEDFMIDIEPFANAKQVLDDMEGK